MLALVALALFCRPSTAAEDSGGGAPEPGLPQTVAATIASEEFRATKALADQASLDEKNDRLEDAYAKYRRVSEYYDRHPELSDCRAGCTCQRFYSEAMLGYIARLWRRYDESIAHYRKAIHRLSPPGVRRKIRQEAVCYSYLVTIWDLLCDQGKRGLASQAEAEMTGCEERIQAELRSRPTALETARDRISRAHGCRVLHVHAAIHLRHAEFALADQAWSESAALLIRP